MKSKELISYAILSVNHSEKKEFLSNFEPFILEIIKKDNPVNITSSELHDGLMQEFDLNIPSNVIKTICKNLAKKGYFKTKNISEISDKYTYIPNFEKIDKVDMRKKSIEINRDFDDLIEKYKSYLINNFSEQIDHNITNELLIEQIDLFIKENNINLASNSPKKSELQIEKNNYLVASFVQYINSNDTKTYSTFLNIVKGNMLSEALYFNDVGNFEKKFNGSKFYFDTSFIMYALGYSGRQRQKPCLELLDLLERNGANLYCFERNITEIIGILTWSKYNLNSGKDSHNTIEYFRMNGIQENDIDLIISDLENSIESILKISVTQDIEYDHSDYSNVIDYQGLVNYLKQNIKYNKEESLDNDVEAIASIMRLRKRKQPTNIEDCGAIFVTTNGILCRKTKEYFIEQQNIGIPPILTDNIVTNLVWLKNPQIYPDLPSLRLLADCIAAVNPNDRLWNKYIDKIELLVANHEIIDTNKIVTLRYLPDAKKILMDKTMGNENAITDGTAKEILDEIEKQRKKEIIEIKENERKLANNKLEKSKQEKIKLEEKISRDNIEKNEIIANIKKRAERRAKIFVLSIVIILSIILGVSSFFTLGFINIPNYIQIGISVIICVILPVLSFIFNYCNFSFVSKVNFYQNKLSEKYFVEECKKLGINKS